MFWDDKKVYAILEPSSTKISIFPINEELLSLNPNADVSGYTNFKWAPDENDLKKDYPLQMEEDGDAFMEKY